MNGIITKAKKLHDLYGIIQPYMTAKSLSKHIGVYPKINSVRGIFYA